MFANIHNNPIPENRISALMPSASNTASAVFLGSVGPRGIGVAIPSGWVGGGIGIQVSLNNTNFMNVVDNYNSAVQISGLANIATATVAVMPGAAWAVGMYPYARFVSFSAGTQGLSAQPSATPLTMLLLS
jgi:hypothetical protein